MSATEETYAIDLAYLRRRYPDPVLRASMARAADGIAQRARALGNLNETSRWSGMAGHFRNSLKETTDAR